MDMLGVLFKAREPELFVVQLEQVEMIFGDKEYAYFNNPNVALDEKITSMQNLCKMKGFCKTTQDFLQFLVQRSMEV